MRTRDIKIAERLGILERLKAFEADLLKIKDIEYEEFSDGINFDLTPLLSVISQVIIIPKYNIGADRDDYWEARDNLRATVVGLAKQYDLHKSGDRIEDYGVHFYFVFNCGSSWNLPEL